MVARCTRVLFLLGKTATSLLESHDSNSLQMTTTRKILWILIGFLFNANAFAAEGIFPGQTYTDDSGGSFTALTIQECGNFADTLAFNNDTEAWTCQEQKAIRSGLEATSIALSVCTIAGPLPMQAKVGFSVASAALHLVNFVINHIPCDSKEDDQKVLKQTCAMLQKQGMICDPAKITLTRDMF